MSFIDYRDPRPVYEQIVNYYERLILTGVLEKDTQMPSVRQTAAELSVNPNTIQKAFAILETRGFIYSVKGRGSFVADNSSLAEEKKREWISDFKQKLKEGREIGVSEEDCMAALEEVWRKK